jgi:hypothetical protein
LLYLVSFVGGLAGSLHCVGMCGIFPLTLASVAARGRSGSAWRTRVVRQVLYNLGRLNTLVFIGALSGGLGAALVASGPFGTIERWLAIAAGSLMIVIGLEILGVIGGITWRAASLVQRTAGRVLGGVMRSPSPAAPLAVGVFNALLPCQLIYAFAARAAATASIREGGLVMLCFGLGTFPAMLALGLVGTLARPGIRRGLAILSGAVVVAFGIVTLLRGIPVLDAWHGHSARRSSGAAVRSGEASSQPRDDCASATTMSIPAVTTSLISAITTVPAASAPIRTRRFHARAIDTPIGIAR